MHYSLLQDNNNSTRTVRRMGSATRPNTGTGRARVTTRLVVCVALLKDIAVADICGEVSNMSTKAHLDSNKPVLGRAGNLACTSMLCTPLFVRPYNTANHMRLIIADRISMQYRGCTLGRTSERQQRTLCKCKLDSGERGDERKGVDTWSHYEYV